MIQLKDLELLQKSVRAISNFITEGNFRFNEKGISIKAIDPSQIVMVDYCIPKNLFEKFEIEEPTLAGLDVEELNKVLKRGFSQDLLEMHLEDSQITLILESDVKREFKLSLIDVPGEDIELPKQEFDAVVEINAGILQESLKDASVFGSSVVLKVNGTDFSLEGKGPQGSLQMDAKTKAKVKHNSGKNQEIVSKYSLSFLENIVREASSEKIILLELKNEAPMKISYDISKTRIQFYLAHMLL
ncbi:MAG: proliferating cell nuclear antigen (pcna) [Candidatus Diapherotrites archaeon]|nr:proliferating cell nuclear antigen (pcna) [Candidatus Diapherotrites archaeon]